MFEDIKRNKMKSGFIIGSFILVITLIIYFLAMAFDIDAPIAIIIAMTFSILSSWASYYNSDKIILSVTKARPATEEEDTKIVHILDALMISADLPVRPRLYVVDDPQPNAFATGRDPEHSIICVTTGLLEKLDYYELEGVIGHELAHIANYDIRLSAIVTVMVGFVVMLSDIFTRTFLYGRGRSRNNDNGNANGILMLIGLVFLILAPIFGNLMKLAISRRREFLADATSAKYTRNPDGLISALEKISSDPNELETANKATASMYISSPFREKRPKKSSIWSTHPSLEERVDALRNLK